MRSPWSGAVGVALIGAAAVLAQPPAPPVTPSAAPTQLPPLLPVPGPPAPPPATASRPDGPPGIEYDPGYLYLPERLPDRSRRQSADDAGGPLGRWWVAPELDLAWISARPAPTNVQLRLPDSAAPGPLLPTAGLSPARFEAALGLAAGVWFGDGNAQGLDASTALRGGHTTFAGTAPGMAVLFPNGASRSAAQVVALAEPNACRFPATFGTFFATADVNYRQKLYGDPNVRLDALVGYRYAYVGDELYLGDVPDPGHNEYRSNRAAVSNAFNGGQIGLAGEFRANGWYAAGSAKVAFGAVTTDVTTTGLFAAAQGGTGGTYQRLAGLTPAEPSGFAVVPAGAVQFGHQLGSHALIYVSYSCTYLSRAARLGDALNPTAAGLVLTDFWVQSIGFGADFRF
jgi:hypothetical protein